MSLKELEDDIKEKNLKSIYFIYGDESYDIERYVEKIKKCFSNLVLGVNFFEMDKNNISDLSNVCEGVSFLGEEKLVIIKNTGLKFNMDILDSISNDKLVIIVTEQSVDKRTTDFKSLSKVAFTVEFAKQNERDAIFFIVKTLGAYGLKIKDEVARYMVSVCTEDKQTLVNEFRKIVAYVEPAGEVTREIIDKICVKTLDAKVFEITDMLLKNDKLSAIKLYDDLIASKTYAGVIESILFKHIKNIYQIKLMMQDDRYKNIDIAKELKIHPFVYSKLKQKVNKYRIEDLEKIIREFDQYDISSKTGKMDQILGLKKILMLM